MSGIALILLAAGATTAAGLSVTASPPALNSGSTHDPHVTAPTTAVPTGGSGTYTYLWTLAVDPGDITITSPTAATTVFSIDTNIGETVDATARCTVTDGVTMATAFVDVPIHHVDFR